MYGQSLGWGGSQAALRLSVVSVCVMATCCASSRRGRGCQLPLLVSLFLCLAPLWLPPCDLGVHQAVAWLVLLGP